MAYGEMAVAQYGGFWPRLGALMIDGLLITGAGDLFGGFIGGFVGGFMAARGHTAQEIQDTVRSMRWGIMLLVWLGATVYFCTMNSSAKRGTLGKMAMGLQVTDQQGRRISALRALGRELAKVVSFCTLLIGFLMVGWTARKQGLHDKLAGTLVIREGSQTQDDIN